MRHADFGGTPLIARCADGCRADSRGFRNCAPWRKGKTFALCRLVVVRRSARQTRDVVRGRLRRPPSSVVLLRMAGKALDRKRRSIGPPRARRAGQVAKLDHRQQSDVRGLRQRGRARLRRRADERTRLLSRRNAAGAWDVRAVSRCRRRSPRNRRIHRSKRHFSREIARPLDEQGRAGEKCRGVI